MIEFIVWQIKLALVSYREKVKDREASLTYRYATYGWRWRWLRDFVDRISTFDRWEGYSRVRSRRWLWKLSHPTVTMRLASLRWSLAILNQIAPYVGPGKYEGNDPRRALMIEWLDNHAEYASNTTGSTEWGLFVMLFTDLDVPWSRMPEAWVVTTDGRGFVSGHDLIDDEHAEMEFGMYERQYSDDQNWSGSQFDDDEPGLGREGQPEFNGAFGV